MSEIFVDFLLSELINHQTNLQHASKIELYTTLQSWKFFRVTITYQFVFKAVIDKFYEIFHWILILVHKILSERLCPLVTYVFCPLIHRPAKSMKLIISQL